MNNYLKTISNGISVEIWEVTCKDCGFVSALAQIIFSDRNKFVITGAGCLSRRDRKATEKMIEQLIAERS